jgi:hypothetical protein
MDGLEVHMDGYDLIREIQSIRQKLDVSLKMLRRSGRDYAQAEHDYKILLRTECLRLRDEGMAVGMITMTAYGIPKVAEARMKRDIAEATYKANQEALNVFKLQLRIVESQLSREWGMAG